MPRATWKGAISFGLVYVPVALYPASHEDDIDFDWLDKRSMDPVGYKRVNKRTGREIGKEHIVKGVKQGNGDYVVLSDEEVREAYPRRTQTIEIEAFVDAADISFMHLERPYFLEPAGKSDKVYALLREAMRRSGVSGIARMVMHTKEHLAALIATETTLMLNTLRWASEIRSADELDIPAQGKSAPKVAENELKMAGQLIENMKATWSPQDYADSFTDSIHALIARKVKAGKTEKVEPFEPAPEDAQSNVVELSELLRQSLGGKRKEGRRSASAKAAPERASPRRASPRRASPRRASPRRPARKRA